MEQEPNRGEAGIPPPPPPAGIAPTGARSPLSALLISLVIPGLGQIMISEERGKGIALLVAYVVCLFLFIFIVPLLVALGIWVFAMWDAYQGTRRWNAAHGFPAG